jgi:hypothetical protein
MSRWPAPGAPLVKGKDEGGLRWFLDGAPVHAGTGLDLCIETKAKVCSTCSHVDWPTAQTCSTCGGRGRLPEYGWLPVRLEFNHFEQQALAYLPTAGSWDMFTVVGDGARFRWPPR